MCGYVWGMTQDKDGVWRFESHFRDDHVNSKTKKVFSGPCEAGFMSYDEAWAKRRELGLG